MQVGCTFACVWGVRYMCAGVGGVHVHVCVGAGCMCAGVCRDRGVRVHVCECGWGICMQMCGGKGGLHVHVCVQVCGGIWCMCKCKHTYVCVCVYVCM